MHHDRKILTLSDARRALTFETKQERPVLVNGCSQDKKIVDKFHILKQDVVSNDARTLSGVITPPKPVIIVHPASIDEQQEENAQALVECGEQSHENVLEEVRKCDGNEARDTCQVQNCDKNDIEKQEYMGSDGDGSIENGDQNEKLTEVEEVNMAAEKGNLITHVNHVHENAEPEKQIGEDTVCEDATKKGKCDDSLIASSEKEVSTNVKCVESPKTKECKSVRSNVSSVVTKLKDSNLYTKVTDSVKVNDSIKVNDSTKVSDRMTEVKGYDVKAGDSGETRRSCAEVVQARSPLQKPGPTVNMNKVSSYRGDTDIVVKDGSSLFLFEHFFFLDKYV